MSGVLAIDLGTTGIKVAVIDDAGRVLSSAGEVLPMIGVAGGGVEQDPNGWWEALGRCARSAIETSPFSAGDIGLVAVTAQYTSTVAVAADGMPLANTIMWMDQRGRRHNPAIPTAEQAARWIDVHGMAPSGNDDIGHVAVFRAEMPDVYEAAAAFGEPSGTSGGNLATSRCDIASSSSLYSVSPHVRLSTESIGNIVFCVAVTVPVRRAAR